MARDVKEFFFMNIYVGNISYDSTEESLGNLFGEYGEVSSVSIITNKYNGKSKGFGFVEMPNDEEADAAISALDGNEFDGRNLKVNKARPKTR